MIGGAEHTVLGLRVGHLVLLDDDLLLQDLDRVQLGGGFLAAQNHLAKGALSQHLQELKVFKCLQREREDRC